MAHLWAINLSVCACICVVVGGVGWCVSVSAVDNRPIKRQITMPCKTSESTQTQNHPSRPALGTVSHVFNKRRVDASFSEVNSILVLSKPAVADSAHASRHLQQILQCGLAFLLCPPAIWNFMQDAPCCCWTYSLTGERCVAQFGLVNFNLWPRGR